MLTANEFDGLLEPIMRLYQEFEESVILDIAKRIARIDVSSTSAWQLQRLTESGFVYQNTLLKLSQITGKTVSELDNTFRKAGVESIKFDDEIYKAAGLNPIPLNLSPAMLEVLRAGLQKTSNNIKNLTMTTAISSQRAYIDASNQVYLSVSSGAFSYDKAIQNAVTKLVSTGVQTVDYASGHKDKVHVAVRRAALTGVTQTTAVMQDKRADEMGCDLVQTSAHAGARPEHVIWQGKIFSRNGSKDGYQDFRASTGYGTVTGLCGANCRHSYYPYFKGISENAYSEKELSEMKDKTVTYQGKQIPYYNATQIQRGIERTIRKHKMEVNALSAAKQDTTKALVKLKNAQAQMRDFTKETGLSRQSPREFVAKGQVPPQPPTKGGKGPIKPIEPVEPEPPETPAEVTPVMPEAIVNAVPVTQKPGFQPSGKPVSSALLDRSKLTNKETKRQANLALQQLDTIHGDGELPEIPVNQSASKTAYGQFWSSGSRAVKIALSSTKSADHTAMTFLHEIGHFLDHSALSKQYNQNWSTSSGEGVAIIEAAKKTNWYKTFWQNYENINSDTVHKYRVARQYANYLMDKREIFARAYCQYIAIKTQNPELISQLKQSQDTKFMPTQWADDDFAELESAFDTLFQSKGWMK